MSVVSLQSNVDQPFYRMLSAQGDFALVQRFVAKRPSVAERMASGKALREKVPRTSHAIYRSPSNRPDPVAILERQNATRVQKLVPVRYGRMLVSPFTFLRGSAAVMAKGGLSPLSMLSVIWPELPEAFTDSCSAVTRVPPRLTRTRLTSPLAICIPFASSALTVRRKLTCAGATWNAKRFRGALSGTLQTMVVKCGFCRGAPQEPTLTQEACCSCRL